MVYSMEICKIFKYGNQRVTGEKLGKLLDEIIS